MNPVRHVPKPLATPKHFAKTVNVYRTRIRDPSAKNSIKILGWEQPSIRVANTVTWLLEHAKQQGLTAREDGYVRAQDLLQHPRLVGLDFPTIEKAIHGFRSRNLKLTYASQTTSDGADNGSRLSCWWIGLQKNTKRTLEDFSEQRVIDASEVPFMIYQAPSKQWSDMRDRGIPRGNEPHILLNNNITIPFHYTGDNTFIRLNSNSVHSEMPLYSSRTINRRRGNKPTDSITTPAQSIPPTMFETAMRVAVQRFPLVLSSETPKVHNEKRRKDQAENENMKHKPRVMQSGVDALRKYGFADVVESSGLGVALMEQQQGESPEKVEHVKVEDDLIIPPSLSKQKSVEQPTKDPPPHSSTILRSTPPHL